MKKPDISEQFLNTYDDLADAIFRHCFFRTFNRELAKDITQETFTRAWQYLAEGKKIKNVKAFLYRTASNLIIDNSRRRMTVSLEELAEEGFEPKSDEKDKILASIENKEALRAMLRLEDDSCDVIFMRYVDDLSPREISAILNEPENRISVRIHRGMVKLRKIVNDEQ